MSLKVKEIDVAKNLKTIEWFKAELIDAVGALFKALIKNSSDAITDALASIIITTYLLGKRVGVTFQVLDTKIRNKLNYNIDENHKVEEWYGDLSELLSYLEKLKR